MRRTVLASLALAGVLGCGHFGLTEPSTTAAKELEVQQQPALAETAPPAATVQVPPTARQRQVMAIVNGQPVYMGQLHELLVEAYGMPLAQQVIATELVQRAAADKNVSVTADDVKAEHLRMLRQGFPKAQDDAERERLLDKLLQTRNMTRSMWNLSARRNALLRKLTPHDFEVPEEAIREEIARRYGRKVVVRHIETQSLNSANMVKELAKKEDFAELARKHSINPSGKAGGLLPPISKQTQQISPALRQVALAMNTPGDISEPVMVSNRFHVLKLEKVIEPKAVKDEEIRKSVIADLRERKISNDGNRLLRKLFTTAEIEFVDPTLKAQHQQRTSNSKGN